MTLLRRVLGETLRGQRLRQRRTLREVSGAARVSLGYLSEVERGQKEASSELLASICDALDVRLSEVMREVSDNLRRTERGGDIARAPEVARVPARQLVPTGAPGRPVARGPVELPVGGDGAELTVEFDVPQDFDRAELVDRVSLDTAGRGGVPVLPGTDRRGAGAVGTDRRAAGPSQPDRRTARLEGDALDVDRLDDRPDSAHLDRRLERIGLDGVDLAELETGDGLGDVDTLLSLTDLSCCLDRPHGAATCLAGATVAA